MFEKIAELFIQDPIATAVNIYFLVALIPMLKDNQKPHLFTSFATGIGLLALGLNGSYKAFLPNLLVIANGIIWITLGVQRILQTRKK